MNIRRRIEELERKVSSLMEIVGMEEGDDEEDESIHVKPRKESDPEEFYICCASKDKKRVFILCGEPSDSISWDWMNVSNLEEETEEAYDVCRFPSLRTAEGALKRCKVPRGFGRPYIKMQADPEWKQ